jgi:molybdenum cofactor biosynthesis enzyme MoaA
MTLEQIGFYTLSDARADAATTATRLMRAELILSARCNFACPYCRGVGGPDLPLADALATVNAWAADSLFAIRFSGGEPLLYRGLLTLVKAARAGGIERIAISSNGSAPLRMYKDLLAAGVNDLSISLDACCAEDADKMAGGIKGKWPRVVANIKALSAETYVTVGVVLTDDNVAKADEIIRFAADLGVGDIRIIPAAQSGNRLHEVQVSADLLERYPILRFRIANLVAGATVRGLKGTDSRHCGLVYDDMAVCEGSHYPCIIYLREGGEPIGPIGPDMRAIRTARAAWSTAHDTHADPICAKNCLDVCVAYNNRFAAAHIKPFKT